LPRVAVFLTESGRSAHLANIQIVPPDVRFEGKVDIASPVVPRQSRPAVLQALRVVRSPPRLGRRAADAPLSSMRIPHAGNPQPLSWTDGPIDTGWGSGHGGRSAGGRNASRTTCRGCLWTA